MKKSNVRRCLQALIEKNKVLLIIWLLLGFVCLATQVHSFNLTLTLTQLLPLGLLTVLLWPDFLDPLCELLIKKSLIERTVHVNYVRTTIPTKGSRFTEVRTCEIPEALRYHKPIPDEMIVDKRLTIGYLPKARLILYVEKPAG